MKKSETVMNDALQPVQEPIVQPVGPDRVQQQHVARCLLRTIISLSVVGASLAGFLPQAAAQGDNVNVQPLEWNVFLRNWQLLGPFPKDDEASSGLDTAFVDDEASLRVGRVGFYRNKLYTWQPYEIGAIDFRNGFNVKNAVGNHVVGYAYTEFLSPVAQKAILAVGHDDSVLAWVNGQQVCRREIDTAAVLDHTTGEVELRQGVNTVLLKIGQGTTAWQAAARFRPAGIDEPLFSFKCQPGGDFTRLPTVEVALLDVKRQVISTHRCNGLRKSWPGPAGYYAVYAPEPLREPVIARLTVRTVGLQDIDVEFPWKRMQIGNVTLDLKSDRPVEFTIVDASTRQPVAGAEVWANKTKAEPLTDADGRVTLADLDPMMNQCWVAAPGFAAKRVNLPWPRTARQQVGLTPGGRTVAGTIVSAADQKPLAGAVVSSGLYQAYSPTAVTDASGHFELYSLPEVDDSLYPTVECRGYVSKRRFSVALSSTARTEVQWTLEPGATVAGRVVQQETGGPVAGVTITTGDDRFGGGDEAAPKTVSDADGRFELFGVEPGQNLLHAFSDDFAPAMQAISAGLGLVTRADFQINPGKPVVGVIIDAAGEPIPQVRLVTDTWNGARMFEREARTDANGAFTLAHMPATVTEVDVLKGGYISQRNVHMTGGDILTITLRPEVTHTITVRDAATSSIVPEVQISKGYLWDGRADYSWSSSQWETDRYYNKLSGVMRVVIDEPMNAEFAYRFRATGFREEIVKVPRDAEIGQNFEVTLQPASTFEGRVVDADTGKPLAGIGVAMVSSGDQMRADHYVQFTTPWSYLQQERFTGPHTVTGNDGLFRLSSPSATTPIDLALVAEDGGFHFIAGLEDAIRSLDQDGGQLELPFPKSGTIEGRVTVAGQPLANSLVHVQWAAHDKDRDNWDRSFGVGGQTTTDANGRFHYPQLGPGSYRISRVYAYDRPGGGGVSMYLHGDDVVLLPGQTLVHNIEQPAGLTLAGVTRGPDGKPLPDCVISAELPVNNRDRVDVTKSDAFGRFTFDHLAAGSYRLTAEHYTATGRYNSTQDFHGVLTTELAESIDDAVIELASSQSNNRQVPQASVLAGTLPPDFTVTPLDADQPFTLSHQSGKVVILAFHAAWSEDFATLKTVYDKYRDNPDFVFLVVFSGGKEDALRTKLKNDAHNYPVVVARLDDDTSLADVFAARNSPGGYIIGPDGRFAAERIDFEELDAAIAATLASPSNESATALDRSQLTVTMSTDGSDRGVPAAKLTFQAIDSNGKMIQEGRYMLSGVARDIVWRYPAFDSRGQLVVTMTRHGIPDQRRVVESPSASESLSIDVASPRVVAGRIVTVTDGTPVAGMRVRLQGFVTGMMSTATDADGQFRIPCFAGGYHIASVGNDRFAVASTTPRMMTVTDDADPQPIEFKAAPAMTIRGRVLDPAGTPVAGATIASQAERPITTDAAGNFELAGIASIGTTQIWAISNGVYGAIRITDPAAEESHTITLGKGLNEDALEASQPLQSIGRAAPALKLNTLDGESVDWEPSAATDHLLVFCALWHPNSPAYIARCEQWAAEHATAVDVISLDWSVEQARREFDRTPASGRKYFAGPGSISLDAEWSFPNLPSSVLISRDGILLAAPSFP